MSFKNGAYATLWEHKDGKGNYHDGRISTSKKYNGNYEEDFGAWVRFIGDAKTKCEKLSDKRQRIKIISCEVTNRWDREAKKEYVNFAIFDFELVDDGNKNNSSNKDKKNDTSDTSDTSDKSDNTSDNKSDESDNQSSNQNQNTQNNNPLNSFSPEQIQALGNLLNVVMNNGN